MTRVVITMPDLRRGGGVAHFYERVMPLLAPEVRQVVVGKRPGEPALVGAVARLVLDTWRLWRELGDCDVDILHVNPSLDARSLVRDGAVALLARARGKRLVVFVRGWQDSTAAAIDRVWAPAFRAVFGHADAFIVLAAEFRTALRRWGYRGPVHTATTAVSQDALEAVGEKTIVARCRREGCLRVLFLSRLRADKGIFEVLEAVRLAERAGTKLRLVVAGDGPDLPAAVRWANEHEVRSVQFVGDVRGDDKHRVMSESDLHLFPTVHGEGMPATVLEAMAYGMTVIACPVGGVRDFFVDGEHGLLCDEPRPERLAELIRRADGDAELRRRLGVAAHRYAVAHFGAAEAARRLDAVYTEVRRPNGAAAPTDTDWCSSRASDRQPSAATRPAAVSS